VLGTRQIWGSHSGHNQQHCLLACGTLFSGKSSQRRITLFPCWRTKVKVSNKLDTFPAWFMLASCLAATLKMEAMRSSETLVDFCRNTLASIPEDRNIHNHGCENLKSNLLNGHTHRFFLPFTLTLSRLVSYILCILCIIEKDGKIFEIWICETSKKEMCLSKLSCNFTQYNPGYCYHSVQNIVSSLLLSKNVKIRIYKTIILSVVLYGCEAWPLTLREEHRLRVFRAGCWGDWTEERWSDRKLEKIV
jgi:hypothetical protein